MYTKTMKLNSQSQIYETKFHKKNKNYIEKAHLTRRYIN